MTPTTPPAFTPPPTSRISAQAYGLLLDVLAGRPPAGARSVRDIVIAVTTEATQRYGADAGPTLAANGLGTEADIGLALATLMTHGVVGAPSPEDFSALDDTPLFL